MYINTGAYVQGKRPATKKALREAVAAGLAVIFDSTSPFADGKGCTPSTIPAGTKLSVVGPDPYRDRKWYATVTVSANGTVKVA